mmetsp:Transcript_7819/g.19386  ORF Transcript_7819/g.19386 Transcript_7819/m.19386 type:complete len:522 (-) Transcript_7819:867-2432(-)
MRSTPHAFRPLLLVAVFLLAAMPSEVCAKIASGKLHLSGVKTESTLVKFAISAESTAKIDLNLTSHGMYEDERELRLRIYTDDDWPRVKRTPLCSEKVALAQRGVPIVFDGYGGKLSDGREKYSARIQHEIKNPPNQMDRRRRTKMKDRSRYFYFTVDDCSLERSYHDGKIPDIMYSISVMNVRPSHSPSGEPIYDHLPADEGGIGILLVLTIFYSGALTLLLFYKLARTIGGEVHVAILVVIAACLTNALSSVCELMHMTSFNSNGYGIYSVDALSGYFEALSDSMVSLVLLSIGGGWTLPTDVVGGGMGKDVAVNKFMQGVKNPAGSLIGLISGGGSGDATGGIVALTIILVHVGLAQWGRTFDDDFDTYHALEHPPGRALMLLRFILGLVFITGVGMVRSGGRCPPSLMSFLTKFGLVGLSYFASLPGVAMFVGSVLAFHQRHQALHWGAAMVQMCSLSSLTWLFTGGADASAYHRLSRVGKHDEGGMTESIASSQTMGGGSNRPTMWRFGKTKIRLD